MMYRTLFEWISGECQVDPFSSSTYLWLWVAWRTSHEKFFISVCLIVLLDCNPRSLEEPNHPSERPATFCTIAQTNARRKSHSPIRATQYKSSVFWLIQRTISRVMIGKRNGPSLEHMKEGREPPLQRNTLTDLSLSPYPKALMYCRLLLAVSPTYLFLTIIVSFHPFLSVHGWLRKYSVGVYRSSCFGNLNGWALGCFGTTSKLRRAW